MTDLLRNDETKDKQLAEEALEPVAHLDYLDAISDRLGTDISPAVAEKMKHNAQKYPVDLARGNALKYIKLGKR